MNDDRLISLNAAIDAVHEAFDECTVWDESGEYTADVVERILDNLPSAQQWIPCKERLPEKPGQYYVSGGDKVWICEFLIIPNFIGGWCNNVANPVVQAWMPLPEPWKGGR